MEKLELFFGGVVWWHILLAYLIGSIPTSLWVGKSHFGVDIRDYGSGNSGTTNTFRLFGKKPGILVLIIDVFKGWFPVFYFASFSSFEMGSNDDVGYKIVLGILALLGHVFPIYARFKGGKGVATLLGVVLAIDILPSLSCLGVFLIVFLLFEYVSLGAILAAISFPIFSIFIYDNTSEILGVFSIFLSLLIIVRHKQNIMRLIQGRENKMALYNKKK